MKPNKERLVKLLQLLAITESEEIDCSQFLHRMAAYVERVDGGDGSPEGDADVVHHLRICPECLEEYEMLCRALRGEG